MIYQKYRNQFYPADDKELKLIKLSDTDEFVVENADTTNSRIEYALG